MIFNFNFLKKKEKKSQSKTAFTSIIEKKIIGCVYINDEGDFVIKYNNKFYNPSKQTLSFKNKKFMFIFDEREYSKILCIALPQNNNIEYSHPRMTLAPGYLVEGDIIKDINNNEFFDLKELIREFDVEARDYYNNNKDKLIALYNERHKRIETTEEK